MPVAGFTASALSLGPRGKRLFESMKDTVTDPVQRELLVEACRLVDQLEQMDKMLRGDATSWSVIKMPRGGGNLYLEIDQLVDKRRQAQATLKQITTALTVAGEGVHSSSEDTADELTKRRETRLAQRRERETSRG